MSLYGEGMNTIKELFDSEVRSSDLIIEPLPVSGSNRRYFRLRWNRGEKTLIGVEGEVKEENIAFFYVADWLSRLDIDVPRVKAISHDRMCYLQDDLGEISLFDKILCDPLFPQHSPEVILLLEDTLRQLARIHFSVCEANGFDYSMCYPESEFDRQSIYADLYYFDYCFLRPSGLPINQKYLKQDFERIADDLALAGPVSFMYRDFQSRNVMIYQDRPFFIDFQGGRKGPVLYDLVSFVWQAKAQFPDPLKQHLIAVYKQAASTYCQLPDNVDRLITFFAYFRSLQVLGAYGYRGNFERKTHFLHSIPFAIRNALQLIEQYAIPYTYLNHLFTLLAKQYVRE